MESNQANSAGKKTPLTPRQLIKRHIERPELPITQEDLNNMNLDKGADDAIAPEKNAQLPAKKKANADELADEIEKNNTGMSYQADL